MSKIKQQDFVLVRLGFGLFLLPCFFLWLCFSLGNGNISSVYWKYVVCFYFTHRGSQLRGCFETQRKVLGLLNSLVIDNVYEDFRIEFNAFRILRQQ